MLQCKKIKRVIAGILAGAMVFTMIPAIPAGAGAEVNGKVNAEEKYPHTIFAVSGEQGAITIHASSNFSVNGNLATNGTIISGGTMNVNGKKVENAGEEMLYVNQKIEDAFFTGNHVKVYSGDYSDTNSNIHVNQPVDAEGRLELRGNININAGIKAGGDILLKGEVLNTNQSVLYSKTGNITVDCRNVNLNGLIYAPFGQVIIRGQNLNMNNIIIIADKVTLDGQNINVNYSSRMAEFLGVDSEEGTEEPTEEPLELYAFGEYMPEDDFIQILWESTISKGTFEIECSFDNITYHTVGTVTNTDCYDYRINEIPENPEIMYFRVTQTISTGETATSIPFVVIRAQEDDETAYEITLLDTDGDGLEDVFEIEYGTDINLIDTDGDGLTDYEEIYLTNTDPLVYDSVAEGISDAQADSDEDGISNLEELLLGTNPLDPDTDRDGISDYSELHTYGTDPLNSDTDGDRVSDGGELKLGLDPLNPETFGFPDAEYIISQTIPADSRAFSAINTEESPYQMSMEITAAGYVEGSLSVRESGYANVMQNDSMIGIVPELVYDNEDSIESVTLTFTISDEYIENRVNLFPEVGELQGIKRLNIFKYFEDINMLLPIETQFDVENQRMYTEVDELGTYCVMDLELWFEQLHSFIDEEEAEELEEIADIEENAEEEVFMARAAMSAPEQEAENDFTEQATRIMAPVIMDLDRMEHDKQLEEAVFEEAIMGAVRNQFAMKKITVSTPVDIVFIIQTAGLSEYYFELQKEMIRSVAERVYKTYPDVRIAIIEYKLDGAFFVASFTSTKWHTKYSSAWTALGQLTYEYTEELCNRGAAFSLMLNEADFRENAGKFVFKIMNGNSSVGDGYFSQLDACRMRSINYSEIMPPGWGYIDPIYAQMVYNAIRQTNGFNMVFGRGADEGVYNHIITYVAPPQIEYQAILPTGWKKVTLSNVLDPYNGADTDGDEISDWNEVITDLLEWETDGTAILPTLRKCMEQNKNKGYAEDGLNRIMNDMGEDVPDSTWHVYRRDIFEKTYILPIYSDPTNEDSDGDGYLDWFVNQEIGDYPGNRDPRPLKNDITYIHLKNEDYVPVTTTTKVSYGGNQGWFKKEGFTKGSVQFRISEAGCGVIAAGDLMLYLGMKSDKYLIDITDKVIKNNRIAYYEYLDYILEVNGSYVKASWFGVPDQRLRKGVSKYFKKAGMDEEYGAIWRYTITGGQMLLEIETMLRNDVPAIFGIGNNRWWFGKKKVKLYQMISSTENEYNKEMNRIYQYKEVDETKNHFLTITGVIKDKIAEEENMKHKIMIEVSSWGEKYYIDYDELRRYIEEIGSGETSALLHIFNTSEVYQSIFY